MELLQVVGRRIAAERADVAIVRLATKARGPGQDRDEHPVGILELPPHGVGVDLLQLGRPVLGGQIGRGRRHHVLVLVEILEPEHEVVGSEGFAVAPLHAPAQVDGQRLVPVAELPALGRQRSRLGAGHIPVHEAVVAAEADTGRPVARAGESPADDAAVPADLVHRLDDERVLADSLLDRRQLAGLHQLRQLRRFLEALGELGRIGDGGRPLELPDQLRTDLWRRGRRAWAWEADGRRARSSRAERPNLPRRRCGTSLAGTVSAAADQRDRALCP